MKCGTCHGCKFCYSEPYIIEHSFGMYFECEETNDAWIDTTIYTKPSKNCPLGDSMDDRYAGGKL